MTHTISAMLLIHDDNAVELIIYVNASQMRLILSNIR